MEDINIQFIRSDTPPPSPNQESKCDDVIATAIPATSFTVPADLVTEVGLPEPSGPILDW